MAFARRSTAAFFILYLLTACSRGAKEVDNETPPATPATLTKSAPPSTPADSLMAVGDSAYWEGEYESARGTWRRALNEAREDGNAATEARVLTWLGLAAWRLGDYKEARQTGEAGLELKQQIGLSAELSRSYNALGLLAWNEGRLADATDLFNSAIATARASNDDEGAAKAMANHALVLTELGEFENARAGFNAALIAGKALENPRMEANALTNLAMLDLRVGSPNAAVAFLEQARRIYHTTDYATGEQTALAQLGVAYVALGEPARAFGALDAALAMARRHGLKQDEAANLELIASFYRDGGEPRRALEFYRQARVINTELGLQLETGSVLRKEAETYAGLGDLALAERQAAEALRIHRSANARFEELFDRLLLADLTSLAGRTAATAQHVRSARQHAKHIDSRIARMHLALSEAKIAERSEDFRTVIAVLDAARPDLRGSHGAHWEADAIRARAYLRLGNLDSAALAARRSVRAVERVRANFASPSLRTAYAAHRTRVYTTAVEILVRYNKLDEAFEVADAARGRALLEHLDHPGGGAQPQVAAHALASGQTLLRAADELTLLLDSLERVPATDRSEADAVLAKQLLKTLTRTRSEYEASLVRASELDPAAATLLGSRQVSASDVRAALLPGEVILEYVVAADQVLILAVDRAGIRSLAAPIKIANLTSRVRLARDLLADPSIPEAQQAAVLGALHNTLIGPAMKAGVLRGAQRLIIIPHDVLGYLSFASLRDPATGRFLVEDYALIHLSSASALAALRGTRDGEEVRNSATRRATVFAPFPERLPASLKEAGAIRSVMKRAKLRVGEKASEAELRRRIGGRSIIHVASHGVLNVANPMFSRMELARGSGAPDDDGRLEVHEILGLTTRSPLVFLSGCETGAGAAGTSHFMQGEDFATLAQAFLFAGAANVVGTLWRIPDESAGVFASRFYQHLREAGPAEALAAAQRDLMRNKRYRAPYYWAGYQVRGDGRNSKQTQIPRVASVP